MESNEETANAEPDEAPGQSDDLAASIAKYAGGFVISILLTLA